MSVLCRYRRKFFTTFVKEAQVLCFSFLVINGTRLLWLFHWLTGGMNLFEILSIINNISGSQVEYFGLLCLYIFSLIVCCRTAVLNLLGCGVENDDLAKKFCQCCYVQDKSNIPFLKVLPSRVSVKITKNLLPPDRKTYFNCIRLDVQIPCTMFKSTMFKKPLF